MSRVAIVGAGIGGLHLAHRLVREGLAPRVYEAAVEPGGVIRTVASRGRLLELGPQRTRLTARMRDLFAELGLTDRVVTAPVGLPLFVYRRGRLRRVPLSLPGLLRTDLLAPRARLRLLLEPFTAAGTDVDASVAHYLTRRFGRAAYEDLLGPLFGGLYASDPADMTVRHALTPVLRDLGLGRSAIATLVRRAFRPPGASPPASLQGGLGQLIEALHHRVQRHVRLACPVRAVEPAAGGFDVVTDSETERCDHVVFTCDAATAASLLAPFAPDAAGRLARLRYNRLALVHLISDAPLRGMGFQTSLAETLETRGVTFNGAMFGAGRDGLFTAFLGGARNPALVDTDDSDIGDRAACEFRAVTGHAAEVLHVSRAAIPAWDRSWAALDGLRLPAGVYLCANYESRVGIPGRLARADDIARHIAARRG